MATYSNGLKITQTQYAASQGSSVTTYTLFTAAAAPSATFAKGFFSVHESSSLNSTVWIGPTTTPTAAQSVRTSNFAEGTTAVTWQYYTSAGTATTATAGVLEIDNTMPGTLYFGKNTEYGILIPPGYSIYHQVTGGAVGHMSYNLMVTVFSQS